MIPPDPLQRLQDDREQARGKADPSADLCSFATVDTCGAPQVRTLVLRDLEQKLAVFINDSSPKWQQLQHQAKAQMLMYFPSIKVQYRLDVTPHPIPKERVDHSWQMRPEIAKVMDWLYRDHFPQSSAVENDEILARAFSKTRADMRIPPPAAPTAQGFYLRPQRIERLQLVDDDLHQRTLYCRVGNDWQKHSLVP